jgi:hypothetical protein
MISSGTSTVSDQRVAICETFRWCSTTPKSRSICYGKIELTRVRPIGAELALMLSIAQDC